MDKKNKIEEFWSWFTYVIHDHETFPDHLLKILDKKVLDLGSYGWEIGSGTKEKYMFIISPGRDKERLVETKEIISLSPAIHGWEFHYAKQPRKAELVFELEFINGKFRFSANDWTYILYKFPDKTYDIVISAKNISHLNDDNKIEAAYLTLETLMGEERVIDLFGDIEVVEGFPDDLLSKESSIKNLLKHIQESEKKDLSDGNPGAK